MRQLAIVVAALLVFAVISPAFAQPFADTPTNHWAYDAIAELAAKGLIEGYPDGTFKGDRAMTRYEMAMVVARLLARIESIQIPTPPPPPKPEVTKADIDMILRLVNEFGVELAAKNVRLTAVEEELNAIKAKLDNVRITGEFRFRYDSTQVATGPSLNGNPNAGSVTAANQAIVFRPREGLKVNFDGSVSPDVHMILGVEVSSTASSTPLTFNSGNFGLTGAGSGSNGPQYTLQNIVNLFFDWKNIFGSGLDLWVGRFGQGLQGFASYPVQFGPNGLLLNTTSDLYGASTGNNAIRQIDGVRLAGRWAALADLVVQGMWWRVTGPTGATTFSQGEDAYGIDANVQIIPGLRIGGSWLGNTIGQFAGQGGTPGGSSQWHVYGNPAVPSLNPVTSVNPALPGCVAVATGILPGQNPIQGGIACPALGWGWSGYVTWDVIPGIHFDGEYANWNDGVHSSSDSGYYANVTVDLGTMLGVGHNFSLQGGYEYLGVNFYPPYGQDADALMAGTQFPGNFQGFLGTLSFEILPNVTILGKYITGNSVSNSQGIEEWQAGVIWVFAPGTFLWVRLEEERLAGISQYYTYRAEMNYRF